MLKEIWRESNVLLKNMSRKLKGKQGSGKWETQKFKMKNKNFFCYIRIKTWKSFLPLFSLCWRPTWEIIDGTSKEKYKHIDQIQGKLCLWLVLSYRWKKAKKTISNKTHQYKEWLWWASRSQNSFLKVNCFLAF